MPYKGQMRVREIFDVMLRHVRTHQLLGWLIFGTAVLVGVLELVVPFLYRQFFNLLAADDAAAAGELIGILVGVFVLYAVLWLLHRIKAIASIRFQARIMADLMQSSEQYLLRHSYQFFSDNFAGSLVRKVNRLPRAFEDLTDQLLGNILPLLFSVIGILVILLYHHTVLGLILFGWVIVNTYINYRMARYKQPFDLAKAEQDSITTGVLADSVTNSTTVQLFSGHEHEHGLYRKVTETLYRMRLKSWGINEIMDSTQGGLMILIEIGIMYVAVQLWQKGQFTIGDFALIQAYLITLFERLWNFGRMLRSVYEALADASEMTEILNTPHGVVDVRSAKRLEVKRGLIEFKSVDFNYHQTRPILHKFALVIKPGERIALVGPSGAGKSTVTKLLLRLYDIDRGTIVIDGQNIAKATQDSVRDAVAFVPQEPVLFHRSLTDNIRYGQRNATDQEVKRAAKQAHCDTFISDLPQGYDTFVGERGVKLSGGERQRVAIARAILKDAPILVLDEATSSLDSESEAMIQDALKKLMKGRTTVVIAHRLSTIMQMDRIVVVEAGAVSDMGTHEELLTREGTYSKLWNIQAGGFIP